MPSCPDCGIEVGGETRFCPECGRPLILVGETGNRRNRGKIAGVIAACIVAIIVVVIVATRPPTPTEPEPAIPTHYVTYTDTLGLFSISYPPEWKLDLESIDDIEDFSQEIISSITSDVPVQEAHVLFMAGLPITGGYIPNANIVVEPLDASVLTHNDMVRAGIETLESVLSDYHEYSRVRTTVDGRTATIIECRVNIPGLGTLRYMFMFCAVNRTGWVATCTSLPDEYSEWEDDFDAVVRSLRILQ